MSLPKTRVKIPTSTLIERIQVLIDEATAEHEKFVAEYEKEMDVYVEKAKVAFEKRVKEIIALKGEDVYSYFENAHRFSTSRGYFVHVSDLPERPTPVGERERFEGGRERRGYEGYRRPLGFDAYIQELMQAKRILEASTDDTISVSATDRYADWI